MPCWKARAAKKIFALLILTNVSTGPALAKDCASAQTQADMNTCAGDAYKQTDAELNAVYGQIMGRLKDNRDTAKLLVSAEKAWMGFRDAQCAFETSSAAGGSVYPFLMAQCLDGVTRKRIDTLKGFLHCEEGDLSCPVPAGQ